MALGDQVGKQAVDEIVAQLPALKQFIDDELTKAQSTLAASVDTVCQKLQETVGGALADITAERTEIVNDIHGVLDRISGARAVFTDGGLKFEIPDRVGK